jgi:hypothetical protein
MKPVLSSQLSVVRCQVSVAGKLWPGRANERRTGAPGLAISLRVLQGCARLCQVLQGGRLRFRFPNSPSLCKLRNLMHRKQCIWRGRGRGAAEWAVISDQWSDGLKKPRDQGTKRPREQGNRGTGSKGAKELDVRAGLVWTFSSILQFALWGCNCAQAGGKKTDRVRLKSGGEPDSAKLPQDEAF